MKKSFKNFLILSQVLGWSALAASACTEEQVKTTVQKAIDNNKSKDSNTSNYDHSNSDPSKDGTRDDSSNKKVTNGADTNNNENGKVGGNKESTASNEESDKLKKPNLENSSESNGRTKANGEADISHEQQMGKTKQDTVESREKGTTGSKPDSAQEHSPSMSTGRDTDGGKGGQGSEAEPSSSPQGTPEDSINSSPGTHHTQSPGPKTSTETTHGDTEGHTSS